MKDPIRRRIICDGSACAEASTEQFIYGVEPLTAQLRNSRYGGLPVNRDTAPESQFDEDDSFDVDPMSNPALDRFERTEAAAAAISKRMKEKNEERINHAE